MDFGTDYSVFANGLPNFRDYNTPVGSQRISSDPEPDLTFSPITDRAVLIQDLYKMQFTSPAVLWWSALPAGPNAQPQQNAVTINLGDMLLDTADAATLAALAGDLETLITSDARFVAASVVIDVPNVGEPLVITELVRPADGSAPIQLVINQTGSAVTLSAS